jgi:hypothetical protein
MSDCSVICTELIDWLIDWSIMSMGWDVSEPRPQTDLLFIPRVICERREPWWWWCRLGKTPDSSTRALWQSYQQRHLEACRMNDEGVRILYISIWDTSTCCKILRHGADSFVSPPNEDMLRIFIAFKNPSPLTGLNPRSLDPAASTLTNTPPRLHAQNYNYLILLLYI